MINQIRHDHSQAGNIPATTEELNRAAEKLSTFHRISWRDALGRLTSAAFRLHHFRDVRTRMLYEALCEVDCRTDHCESSDD